VECYTAVVIIGNMKKKIPNPGSDAAIKKGCICPVLDNGHGDEELGKIRGFICNMECPIHVFRHKDVLKKFNGDPEFKKKYKEEMKKRKK